MGFFRLCVHIFSNGFRLKPKRYTSAVCAKCIIKNSKRLQQAASQSAAELVGFTQDCIYGQIDIKLNSAESNSEVKVKAASDQYAGKRYAVQKISSFIKTMSMGMHNLTATLVIGIGGILALMEKISVADVMAAYSLFYVLCNPIRNISSYISRFRKSQVHYGRIKEIMDLPEEREGGACSFDYKQPAFVLKDFQYSISENISMSADDVVVSAGEITFLMGKSGSGKSTLAKLLIGYSDDYRGELKAFGTAVKETSLTFLRQNIMYVSGDFFSIAENYLKTAQTEIKQGLSKC